MTLSLSEFRAERCGRLDDWYRVYPMLAAWAERFQPPELAAFDRWVFWSSR